MIPLPDNPPTVTPYDEGTKDRPKPSFADILTANSLRCRDNVSKTFAILETTYGAGTRPAELALRLSTALGWYLKQAESLRDGDQLETSRRVSISSTAVRGPGVPNRIGSTIFSRPPPGASVQASSVASSELPAKTPDPPTPVLAQKASRVSTSSTAVRGLGLSDRIGLTRFSRPPPGYHELASVQATPVAPSDLPAKTPDAPTALLDRKAKRQEAREAREHQRKARLEQAFKEEQKAAARVPIDYAAQFRAKCRGPPEKRVYTPYEQALKDGLEAIINEYNPDLYYPTPDEDVPWTGLIESITMELPRYYTGGMSRPLRVANATYYAFERTVVRLWKAMMWEEAMRFQDRGTDWMKDGGLERMWALTDCMDGYIPRWARARLTRCDGWRLPSEVMYTWWPNGETKAGMSPPRDVGVNTTSKGGLVKGP